MAIDYKIRDEKLQYGINKDEVKISTISSRKINKCDYLTGEKILPSDQSTIIEQEKSTFSPSVKHLRDN